MAAGGCRSVPEQGSSSMEMLDPIAAPQATTDKKAEPSSAIVVVDIPPTFKGEIAKPVYPPAALAAHAGIHVVYVTITIDTTGIVTEIAPSWQRLNIPDRFSDDFLEAVRTAVRAWRFEPARYVYWRKTPDGDLAYSYAETVPAKTDIKFTFESSGTVR
jgi:hypothetical protein